MVRDALNHSLNKAMLKTKKDTLHLDGDTFLPFRLKSNSEQFGNTIQRELWKHLIDHFGA